MSDRISSGCAPPSLPENLDLQMLHDAQACLRCPDGHHMPSKSERGPLDRLYGVYDPLVWHFVGAYDLREADAEDCRQERGWRS